MRELTLLLNTAEKRIQFALCEDGAVLCGEDWLAQRGGTELLAPALRKACTALGTEPETIRRIACVAGPGNFTGLRIGLTTSAGLARAVKAKQAPLPYLQCIAANVPALPGEKTLVLVNARQGLAYGAFFLADESGFPQPLQNSFLLPFPSAAAEEAIKNADFLLGSAVNSNQDFLKNIVSSSQRVLWHDALPHLSSLLRIEQRIDWNGQDGSDISPLYLRDCDAVENLDSIARAQGRTPELVHNDLEMLTHAPLNPDILF
ncbi:MAG: tRNA (adenosine(37)-N6)-threonylcarbamoyltransferase complex dimerization subunit type 1 TsaB [Mailhella sp.]